MIGAAERLLAHRLAELTILVEPLDLCPMGMQRSYMRRLKGVVSMIFTWTVEVRLSHTRGGANMRFGPISRMFSVTVSGSSGKLTVNPFASAVE